MKTAWRKKIAAWATAFCLILAGVSMVNAQTQDSLPFPLPPMGGKVGPTMQESVHKWREQARHLPEDAPNILIVMLDDAGFGQAATTTAWVSARLTSWPTTGMATPASSRNPRPPVD